MTEQSQAEKNLRILLIEDDPDSALIVRELLSQSAPAFTLKTADTLTAGFERIGTESFDVVLLDLFLPETGGLDTLARFRNKVPDLPVVVMTSLEDEKVALEAVRRGAQDFLVKGTANGPTLARVLRYAVERHLVLFDSPGLRDRVTGLHSRRAFLMMADQHLKSVQRTKDGFIVFFGVLNGLRDINKNFGKDEGNQALKTSADILRENFRTSDIIARLGVDRFGIIAPESTPYSPRILTARLQKKPTYTSAQYNRYKLSLSVCAVRIDPQRFQSVRDIVIKERAIFHEFKEQPQGSASSAAT